MNFNGEHGIDCGGLSREFFDLLGSKIMGSGEGLFKKNRNGRLIINPKANNKDPNGQMFYALGYLVSLSIKFNFYIGAAWADYINAYIFDIRPTFDDILEMMTPQDLEIYHREKDFIFKKDQMTIEEIEAYTEAYDKPFMGRKFTNFQTHRVEIEEFEKNGAEKDVTPENYEKYISKSVNYYFLGGNKANQQLLEKLKSGFQDGLNFAEFKEQFNYKHLPILMCGATDEQQLASMITNTLSFSGYEKEHNSKLFIDCLNRKKMNFLKNFLKAITGSSSADPFSSGLNIKIEFLQKGVRDKDIYIHTCFNSVECIHCEDIDEMEVIFIANFSGGNDKFTIG